MPGGGASAQPYGATWVAFDNATFKVTVGAPYVTADNHKISGTNILVGTAAQAQHRVAEVSDPIQKVRLWKSKLEINLASTGEVIYNDTHVFDWNDAEALFPTAMRGPAADLDPATFENVKNPRDLRFASTHYSHDTQLTIKLTCQFKYRRESGTVGETEEITAAVKPRVWNKVVLWRTQVNEYGFPLQPQDEGWVWASYDRAKAAFLDAKYDVPNLMISNKTTLLAAMPSATAVFGLSHGSLSRLTDSVGVTSPANTITWAEFGTALGNRYSPPGIPPVSHFFAYACQTMPGGQMPDLFWLWREPLASGEPIVNACAYGFDERYVFCTEENQHIEALFAHFSAGKPAAVAVARANSEVEIPTVAGSRNSKAPLKFAGGDQAYATFKHVYLPPAIRDALPEPDFAYADWKWLPADVP